MCNPEKNDGWTPFHSAAKYGHLKNCEYMTVNIENKTPGEMMDIITLVCMYLFEILKDSGRFEINYFKSTNQLRVRPNYICLATFFTEVSLASRTKLICS